jgi:hypothetical protein
MSDGNDHATRQDIACVQADVQAIGDHLVKALQESKTELLKAFFSFAESNHQRLSQLEGNQGALISRIGTLEDRMTEIERRVKFPNRPTQ